MNSADTKVIKQNFIPTLALNGMYAYGSRKHLLYKRC